MITTNRPTAIDFNYWMIGDTRSDIGAFFYNWDIYGNRPTATDFNYWMIGDTRSDIGTFIFAWNTFLSKPTVNNFKYNLYGLTPRNDVGAFDSVGFINMPNAVDFNYWLLGEERADIGAFTYIASFQINMYVNFVNNNINFLYG